jgi:hypothetical protein
MPAMFDFWNDVDDQCEVCGQPGMLIDAVLLGPDGQHHRVLVHVACENSPYAKRQNQRSKAAWN